MSVPSFRISRGFLLGDFSHRCGARLRCRGSRATQLLEVVVTRPKEKDKLKPKPMQVRAAPRTL
jgi:hypothetical protein